MKFRYHLLPGKKNKKIHTKKKLFATGAGAHDDNRIYSRWIRVQEFQLYLISYYKFRLIFVHFLDRLMLIFKRI